jgi:hypothetical protein
MELLSNRLVVVACTRGGVGGHGAGGGRADCWGWSPRRTSWRAAWNGRPRAD